MAALRALAKAPGFTLVAVVTLGLGIGANTAVFSVADRLLLRALPYDDPDALTRVWADFSEAGGDERAGLTVVDLGDYRSEPDLFAALAGWEAHDPTWSGIGGAEVIRSAAVTEGMFSRVLRVQPMLGRSFLAEEDRPGGTRAVILSHSFWRLGMGSDRSALGRAITLDDVPYTVIGVMPEGFRPPFVADAELWTSAQLERRRCRECEALPAIGRLAPGTSIPIAHDRSQAVARRLAEAYPLTNAGMSLTIVGLREDLTGESKGLIRLLFAATGLVLLMSCANVANLMLTRGAGRRPDFLVRVALGAGRGPLLAQSLAEAAVLTSVGGLLALGVAAWLSDLITTLAPAGLFLTDIDIDRRILAFNALLVLAIAGALAVLPALGAIGGTARRVTPPGPSSRRPGLMVPVALVVTQVAVAMVITLGAASLLQMFHDLRDTDLGFEDRGVLAMTFSTLPTGADTPEGFATFRDEVLAPLSDMPRVLSVGVTTALPLTGNDRDATFRIRGRPDWDEVLQTAAVRGVGGEYFYTMGQRLVDGRSFTDEDQNRGALTLIVNQSFARRFLGYPFDRAVGAAISLGSTRKPIWRTVVGVTQDVKHEGPRSRPSPAIYMPRLTTGSTLAIVLKTDGDPLELASPARGVVAGMGGPSTVIAPTRAVPMSDLTTGVIAPDRFSTSLLSTFAGLALLMAGVGLYSLLSHRVNGRSMETGIRLALGAGVEDVRRRVVGAGLWFTTLGVLLGLGAAVTLSGWRDRLVGGVPEGAASATLVTIAVLVGVALVSSWIPSRSAARTDPAMALRDEQSNRNHARKHDVRSRDEP
jgi:putative ABC transport system permease protein